MQVYYDRDADVGLIKNKKIAVIGYGSQGHAHALNLRDSGVKNVVVALRAGSPSAKKAKAEKLKVMTNAEAAKWADVVMMLSPDEGQAQIYQADLKDNMKKGAALAFAHGLAVHFQLIEPRADLDIFMVAPKGPGHTVRSEYVRGAGVPMLLAIHAGKRIDEIGPRKPMTAGSLMVVAGTLLPAVWPGIAALYLSCALIGVGFMLVQVAMQLLIGQISTDGTRLRNYTLQALGFSFSGTLGPVMMGYVIEHAGYRPAFFVLFCFGFFRRGE